VNVDRNFRIVLLGNEKDPKAALENFKPNPAKKTLQDIVEEDSKKRRKQLNEYAESEEEIEELRKFRLNEQNRKMAYIRFYMFGFAVLSTMSAYIYFQKNRRKSIAGSTLHHTALELIQGNKFATAQLGKRMKFMGTIRGAAIGDDAEFELDAIGDKYLGVFKVKGEFAKKTGDWDLKEIEMVIKDQKGKEIEKRKIF
jgi:hypothetical protein